MKKRVIALILSLAMVLSCMQWAIVRDGMAYAAETDYTAPCGTAAVDGTKDAAYSKSAAIEVNKDAKNAVVSDRATGKVYTLFDGDYLYVFAEITDPTPTYNVADSDVQVDVEGFNLYLDFLYEDSASYPDHYYGDPWSCIAGEQGRIRTGFVSNTGGDAAYTTTITGGSGDNRYAVCDKGGFDALVVSKQTASGYNTEMRIALSDSLKGKLAGRDAAIGIGFQINDNQDGNLDYPPGSLASGQSSYREGVCWNDPGINNEWKTGSKDFTTMALPQLGNTDLPLDGYTAPYASATVDGAKDDCYDSSNAIDVNRAKNNVLATGATAKVYTLFDAQYLYFFAEVTDSTVVTDVDPSSVIKDKEGMIFFLDYLTLEDTPYKTEPWGAIEYEQGRIHANFVGNADGNATYHAAPYVYSDKGNFETQMVSVQTAVGYNIELRVKLSDSVRSQLAAGEEPVIGVGFQVNDDSDGDYVRNNVCWDDAAMNNEWITGYGCSVFKPMILKDFGGCDKSTKVLSQNILNNARYDNDHALTASVEDRAMAMTQLINQLGPDSVGFQEVCKNASVSWPKWLAENLTDYAYVGFGRDFTGDVNTVAEDFANNVCSGEATPIFYRKDKFDLLEGGTRWLSDTPEEAGADWGASYPRIMTWAVLKNKQTGQVYAHINTHTDFSYYAQRNSMAQIIAKIAGLQAVYGTGLPVVITADWNMAMTATAYNDMVTNTTVPIADSAFCLPESDRVNWGTTFHDLGAISGGTLPIDMAFITYENASVVSHEVVHPADHGFTDFCLSDHYGVCITFDPALPTREVWALPDTLVPSEITASYGTAALDGQRDPVAYRGASGNVKVMSDKLWSEDLAGGQVWMAYDDSYLYILAQVQDPTPASSVVFASGSLPNEGITFMLDFLNSGEGDANYLDSEEQGMLTLGYSPAAGAAIRGTARQFDMACEQVTVNTATGYNVEVKVALTQQLKDRLASGEEVAISGGVQLHDDRNNDGTRDITLFTDINLDNEWRNVSTANGGSQTFPDIRLEPRQIYTVTLDASGGTVSPGAVTAIYGRPMGDLPTPARDGYEFLGWFDDQGTQYTAQTLYSVEGDLNLTARWEVYVCQHTYTSEITVSATCTADGVRTYTCSQCGDSYTETIPATGHSFVEGKCETCGEADPDYKAPSAVTVKANYPGLAFMDEIYYNVYFTVNNPNSEEIVEMGLITWTSPVDGDVTNAEYVCPGAVLEGNYWKTRSQAIAAKNMGEELYFKAYAKLADGTYIYSVMRNYSAKSYCESKLSTSSDTALKAMCVALMNYGAAAQEYFGYKTDELMNSGLTEEQKALAAPYSDDMIPALGSVGTKGDGLKNNGGYTQRYPSVTFGGALAINYNFKPANTPENGMKLYVWTEADVASVDALTLENASQVVEMTDNNGLYMGQVSGIAAKNAGDTYFVCGVYESNGTTYYTGVLAYSVAAYCKSYANNSASAAQPLASTAAIYTYYADAYLNK